MAVLLMLIIAVAGWIYVLVVSEIDVENERKRRNRIIKAYYSERLSDKFNNL